MGRPSGLEVISYQ